MNGLADILINAPAFPHSSNDCCKIIVCQNQVGCRFCHFRPRHPHGTADICGAQGRGIIDSVTCHGNDFTV